MGMTMKKRRFLALAAAAFAASQAAAQAVQTGIAPWDTLPRARVKGLPNYPAYYIWAQQLFASEACRKAGYSPERFNIDTPYAVLLDPDGEVKRIVIEENKACPGVDYVVGLVLQDLSHRNRFHRTGEARARWYGGRISFAGSPQSQ
jgi:hypothetical protein